LDKRVRIDDLQVVADLRREIVAYASDLGASREAREAVALAVSEALTNVVINAWIDREPGDMLVAAHKDGDGHLVVSICDDGSKKAARTDRQAELEIGMELMNQLADEVHVSGAQQAPGRTISLRFALDAPGTG
jgi:anti-sigma regulatory factor (Ser/Thr protein kinase)